jgi:hypothetical protein
MPYIDVEDQLLVNESKQFLNQPTKSIVNPNKKLKEAYEKDHFKGTKFDHMRMLKKIRKNLEEDSISSHGGTDDESFDVAAVSRRKKNVGNSAPKRKGRPKK